MEYYTVLKQLLHLFSCFEGLCIHILHIYYTLQNFRDCLLYNPFLKIKIVSICVYVDGFVFINIKKYVERDIPKPLTTAVYSGVKNMEQERRLLISVLCFFII